MLFRSIKVTFILCFVLLLTIKIQNTLACSTIKLQTAKDLLYCHNLNANGMDVSGLIFINKRGVFKIGSSWSELITKDQSNPSFLKWISKYGSVTFNTFGKDLPDGGMNEAGLYIWEMGLNVEYTKRDNLPKLSQMQWMQYVLDNYSSIDDAITSANEIDIDGWGWHFFVGDVNGNCASIEFIDGKVIVNKGETMPVPGLFNIPYSREVELSHYYKGFGGFYEPTLTDPEVPRFVKTAVMLRDYKPSQNIVDDGFFMLKNLTVQETPDWSVIFDVRKQKVYYKTSLNPEIKMFSISNFNFSNNDPIKFLNIDSKKGGDVSSQFHLLNYEELSSFINELPLPKEFYGMGGLTKRNLLAD